MSKHIELSCFSEDGSRLTLEDITHGGYSIEVCVYDEENNVNTLFLSKKDAKKLRKALKKFEKGEL